MRFFKDLGKRLRLRRLRAGLKALDYPVDDLTDEELDKRCTMLRLRAYFRALGHPVDDLSDEEIEAGIMKLAAAVRSFGTSCEDFAKGMSLAARKFQEFERQGEV
jgi:hypothetical protein